MRFRALPWLLVSCVFLASAAWCQEATKAEPRKAPPQRQDVREVRPDMRASAHERLRQDLGLTDEQAAKIIPQVEAIEKERTDARVALREAGAALKKGLDTNVADAELQKLLDRLDRAVDEHRARARTMLNDLDRSLTVRQRAQLRMSVSRSRREGAMRARRFGDAGGGMMRKGAPGGTAPAETSPAQEPDVVFDWP